MCILICLNLFLIYLHMIAEREEKKLIGFFLFHSSEAFVSNLNSNTTTTTNQPVPGVKQSIEYEHASNDRLQRWSRLVDNVNFGVQSHFLFVSPS
ncbi:hypothetical protein T4D_15366 [Trichinella pseudospiralis]|uniref:Uncharacterized protein n=1 Tax=Trichinella pseudospiralis TaxID=6337 RepID=A0A0V1FUN7_TRIPS|nr:hypothetical protein T4D_15366 [Trichinella pseudospiralis]